MTTPHDHNQLATLHSMAISFDASSGTFEMERVFDFSESPHLDADAVTATWRELFEDADTDAPGPEGSVSVDGDLMTLRFESEGVETRHDLKPLVGMVASELVGMVSTHDTDQAIELTESLVKQAYEADDLMG